MSGKQFANLDFQSTNRIVNLPNAQQTHEPATLGQLNAAIEGQNWKDSCRVSTQGNLTLASPGASIDGVTMSLNDRVLVRAQTTQTENGIYVWTGAASAMVRSSDANSSDELEQAITTVEEGSNAGVQYRQTQVNFVLGTGNVLWTTHAVSAPPASDTTQGIIEIATQAEVNGGTDSIRAVTPLTLANSTFAARQFSAAFGDGTATQFDVAHNLNNQVCIWAIREVATGQYVDALVTSLNANTLRVNCTPAPASGSLRIDVIARVA